MVILDSRFCMEGMIGTCLESRGLGTVIILISIGCGDSGLCCYGRYGFVNPIFGLWEKEGWKEKSIKNEILRIKEN